MRSSPQLSPIPGESTVMDCVRTTGRLKVMDVVEEAENRTCNRKACSMRVSRLRKANRIHDHFKIGDEMLGHGAFGVVFSAESLVTGAEVAIKVVPTKDMDLEKFTSLFNEVENCLHMDHPNICRVFEVYEDENSLQLVMEKCDGDDLYNHLAALERYSEIDASKTCKQMMEAINYCHGHNVVHRDLKLDNWVYKDRSPDSLLKLIDFGFSKVCAKDSKELTAVLGTCYYVAPEVVNGPQYDNRCDLWSLGVVAYMLLTGSPPFWGSDADEVLAKVRTDEVEFDDNVWRKYSPLARDFVTRLLTRNPDERPTAAHMVKHAWLPHDDYEGDIMATHIDPQVLTNMRTFAKFSALKRMALTLMAEHFSHTEVNDLEQQFMQLDFEKNGSISVQEFTAVLARETNMSSAEAEKMFSRIDCLGEHEISYTEFIVAAGQAKELLQDRYMREAFEWFDKDGDGFISPEDMQKICGDDVEGRPTLEIVRHLSQQDDGKISFDDWRQFLLREDGDGDLSPLNDSDVFLDSSKKAAAVAVHSDASTSTTKPSDSPRSCEIGRAAQPPEDDDIGAEDVKIVLPSLTMVAVAERYSM
jgi:calcium-dependent protein kinase